MDLAVTIWGNQSLLVLPNLGNGTFASAVEVPSGPFPTYIATGDFNGDGKQDIAITNNTNSAVNCTNITQDGLSILINSGNGTFGLPTTLSVSTITGGTSFAGITSTDTNGDGKLDLAVTDTCGDRVIIFENDGTGTFTDTVALPVMEGPSAIISADLDSDFDADLAITGRQYSLSILRNSGTDFTAVQHFLPNLGCSTAFRFVSGDMDGDGDLDMLVSRGLDLELLKNNGAARFDLDTKYLTGAGGAARVVPADIDGDGDLDITLGLSGKVVVLENRLP